MPSMVNVVISNINIISNLILDLGVPRLGLQIDLTVMLFKYTSQYQNYTAVRNM